MCFLVVNGYSKIPRGIYKNINIPHFLTQKYWYPLSYRKFFGNFLKIYKLPENFQNIENFWRTDQLQFPEI